MLRLREIEIRNFAIFDRLVVKPSVDPDRPLTVVRAENGSGKTTLLRALLWGMYGESGLPGVHKSRYSVHPAWWTPNSDGIETTVELEFETDGSSRFDLEAGPVRVFRLTRSVRTVSEQALGAGEPDFRRLEERRTLMQREDDGRWRSHEAGPDAVVDQLLPRNLCDFFVMDADEATDFVGGTEAKVVDRQLVEKKTTEAVRSLLGLEVFDRAARRLHTIAEEFGREATKAAGDQEAEVLQARQDELSRELEGLRRRLEEEGQKHRELQAGLAACREELNAEMVHVGALEPLAQRKHAATVRRERAQKDQQVRLAELSRELESTQLLAPLSSAALAEVVGGLQPSYDAGKIPLRHVGYVRGLLRDGTCVCGQELADGTAVRQQVEAQLAAAVAEEREAGFLGELYESASSLLEQARNSAWLERQRDLETALAAIQEEVDEAEQELRDVNVKLQHADHEKVRILRDQEASLETQVESAARSIGRLEQQHKDAAARHETVRKKLEHRQRGAARARVSNTAREVADLSAEVLRASCEAIRDRQVADLSDRMNELFQQMAANVTAEDFEAEDDARESVRMIAQVGIRPVEAGSSSFEIFALNHRGRSMPPTEINGASRRVLALSFILGLCAESDTRAPLVADSLLNSMSGSVRRNTLDVTVRNSDQPILLLTGSDLESETEVDTVERYGGALYTLTGQWHAADAGQGGDVVRSTGPHRLVARLCGCGPRQYCRVCERQGQVGRPGWSQRPIDE